MAKYQKYAEYQDSGVEWLAEIPSHWDCFSGKRVFASVRKSAYETDQQLAASQKYGVIPQKLMMELNDSKVMLALKGTESFRHVEENNFVISLRSFEGGIEYSQYTGCVSPAYTVLQDKKTISYAYFKHLFKSAPYIAALQSTTDSLRDGKSISYEQFGAIPLPLCDVDEQEQIANFLDHETAQIDTLIAKQEKLIELLKEKRQAVISHAVTKGLNPDVSMKDSGVEWLGQVPEHWTVKKIKYLGSIINGYAFPSDGFTEEGIRILKISNIQNMYLDWSDLSFVSEIVAKSLEQFSVKNGDLVFALTRPIISTGIKAAIVESSEKILLNQRNAILRPNQLCLKKWLYFMILNGNFVQEFNNQIDKTGQQPNISTISIGNLAIPVAPITEQKIIIEFIEEKLKVIDQLISKAESAIQLMQERRTALISSAVTGKINVTNWQKPNHNNNQENTELGA